MAGQDTPGADSAESTEQRVLRAVKFVLTSIVKETATPPGVKHPLSDQTLHDIRQCLSLISGREQELRGEDSTARPQTPADRKPASDDVHINISDIKRR